MTAETEKAVVILRRTQMTLTAIANHVGYSRSKVAEVIRRRCPELVADYVEFMPTREEIWGTPDPKTGQMEGGLVHEVQKGWSEEDRLRRQVRKPTLFEFPRARRA